MQLTDILGRIGGLQSIARELGVSESQAANGADALLPAILGGFKKQAQAQPAGLDGLGGVLGQLGGGNLLDDVLSDEPTNDNRIRVELDVSGVDSRIQMKHGLTGSVEIEVEQTTPRAQRRPARMPCARGRRASRRRAKRRATRSACSSP